MAKRASVFGDEWRRCLKEHYKYVVKQQDKRTESTLTPILNRFGFTEDELKGLYIEATMRAEEMPEDFVPDMQQLGAENVEEKQTVETSFQVHPAECNCPSCMEEVLELGHDEEGQPLPVQEEEKPKDAKPKQKSMF
jgi:hypothetical protein